MQGDASNSELRGVMPNAFSHIFEFIKGTKNVQFLIRCSYLEIYNEEIRDLLAGNGDKNNPIKYDIRDDPTKGVYVSNLTNVVCETEEQMMHQLDKGLSIRTVAETLMNDKSSRSHSIFTVIIEMSTKDETGKDHVKVGKLNLVDLAGSERQKKTGAVGKVLKEGAKINLSLLTLGCVISALADGKSKHIQYRDSKLTRLLQDSLGGNTKTCMVAAISPAESNYDETLSTLRYANNAKNIKNKPRINEDPKDTMIREFKEEIERLKKLLMSQSSYTNGSSNINHDGDNDNGSNSNSINSNGIPSMALQDMMSAMAAMPSIHHQSSGYIIRAGAEEVEDEEDNYNSNSNNNSIPSSGRNEENSNKSSKLVSPSTKSPRGVGEGENTDNLNQERDHVLEQLKAKESEIEQERRLREELNQRLAELQHMFVGKSESEGSNNENKSTLSPEEIEAQAKAEAIRLEAERIHKERKLRARKRREQLEKEDLTYVLEEKKAVEDELDELRQSLATTEIEKNNYIDTIEKKVTKVRRKLEKKLRDAQMEMDGLKDDFEYQREQLLDALREEERNSKIYQTICKALLSEKEVNKIIDKCRYDDDGELIMPHIKPKSIEISRPSSSSRNNTKKNSSNSSNSNSYNSSSKNTYLPDLPTPGYQNNSNTNSNTNSKDTYDYSLNYTNKPLSINPAVLMSNDTTLPPMGGKSSRNSPTKQGIASNSTRVITSRGSDGANYSGVIGSSLPSSSYSDDNVPTIDKKEKEKEGKKKKNKKSKNTDHVVTETLPDEAGGGEFAGPLSDWGFADITGDKDVTKPTSFNQSSTTASTANTTDQEYSDEEFEVEEDNVNNSNNNTQVSKSIKKGSKSPSKSKQKSKNISSNEYDSDNSLLVPINKKSNISSTNNKTLSQSTSLPLI